MPLFKGFGQPDIEEIAVKFAPPNLASLDQCRKDVLLERTRQVVNQVEDFPFQHIDPAIDDPWPGPAQILFQKRDDPPLLFDHPSIARGVGNRPQRQGRHGSVLLRRLFQSPQIDVEERVSVHHEEARIERFARDRQCAGGAERRRLPQHPDCRVADPAPVVGRLQNLSEIAPEQEDVPVAVPFDHLEEIVEERPVAGDRQHWLRNGLRDRAEPGPLPPARITACRIAHYSLLTGRFLSERSLLAPDAVRLGRSKKDMVERACRHGIDDRSAVRIDMVDPSARDGTAEESRQAAGRSSAPRAPPLAHLQLRRQRPRP